MKLRRTTILAGIEHTLREKIAPLIGDDFARNDLYMTATLVSIEREERDTMVALMVEEHERLRALFGDAASVIEDPALGDRLKAAAQAPVRQNLRISALEKVTGELRDLLVELHRYVEARDDSAARDLDRAIWRAIRDTEDSRNPRG